MEVFLMPEEFESTMQFSSEELQEEKVREVIKKVFEALEEKGYSPVNQLVGYLLSGDPAYITSYSNARTIISTLERDEIVKVLLNSYLRNKTASE
jgi:uncharacterized protein (UPF0297 family)